MEWNGISLPPIPPGVLMPLPTAPCSLSLEGSFPSPTRGTPSRSIFTLRVKPSQKQQAECESPWCTHDLSPSAIPWRQLPVFPAPAVESPKGKTALHLSSPPAPAEDLGPYRHIDGSMNK